MTNTVAARSRGAVQLLHSHYVACLRLSAPRSMTASWYTADRAGKGAYVCSWPVSPPRGWKPWDSLQPPRSLMPRYARQFPAHRLPQCRGNV